MNYNNKKFKAISNTPNGETNKETIFEYKQEANILTSEYSGGNIKQGHLLGIVDENGGIKMKYHQINIHGELLSGTCQSTPEILSNGKIRLHEQWQWTSGDCSHGKSIIEEI